MLNMPPNAAPDAPGPTTRPMPQQQGGPVPAAPGGPGGPAPAGAPMPPGAQAAMQQVDKNNPVQMLLLHRIMQLTPEDQQAIDTGVSPPAVAALKKVLPEIGFLLDLIGKGGGAGANPGAPGTAPQGAPGPSPVPGTAGQPIPPTMPPQRPVTKLGGM